METYHSLEKEFDRNVEKLQAKCKHERLTPWMEEWWAPGHSTGNVLRRCKRCNKEIRKEGLLENYRRRYK